MCLALLVVTLLAVGCSDDDPADEADETSQGDESETSGSVDDSSAGATRTTVLASLDELGLSTEELTCAEQRLAGDVDPSRASVEVLDEAVEICRRIHSLVNGLGGSGRYTDEQLSCLAEAVGALSDEDFELLIGAALVPSEPSSEAQDITEELFRSCALVAPA